MESRNTNTSVFRSLDWVTVIIYLLLVAGGIVSVYAASYDFDNASIFSFDEFSGNNCDGSDWLCLPVWSYC